MLEDLPEEEILPEDDLEADFREEEDDFSRDVCEGVLTDILSLDEVVLSLLDTDGEERR